VDDATTRVQTLLGAEVDIERMEALVTWVALTGVDGLDSVMTAATDTSPTVRIVALELLAASPFVEIDAVEPLLLTAANNDTWPEVRGAGLLGLARREHPRAAIIAAAWLDDPELEIAMHQVAST